MFNKGKIEIEAEDYSSSVTAWRLTREIVTSSTRTLDPDVNVVDNDNPTWSLVMTVVQGSELDDLLMATATGATLDVISSRERGVGKKKWTYQVASAPGEIGGELGTTLTYEVTLPLLGQPVPGVQA